MNNRKNLSYTILTNLISMGISALMSFALPKILGITSYGYYQLFLFYNAYTPIAYLGWSEGILLRFGGKFYDEIDKRMMSGQIWAFTLSQFAIGMVLIGISAFMTNGAEKEFVLVCLAISIAAANVPLLMQNFFMAVGKIREHCLGIIIHKGLVFVLLLCGMALRQTEFQYYVIAELMGCIASALYYLLCAIDILRCKPQPIHSTVSEAKQNIEVGYKLLIANLTNMLIVGIVRACIENHWSVDVFGKVSLTLSVSNFILKFVSAVAIVMFPMLRRMEKKRLVPLYHRLSTGLILATSMLLVAYYPLKYVLVRWLPQYQDGLKYMAILFPICIFESKTSLVTNTYLKTLRKERAMMNINIAMVCISAVGAYFSVYKMNSLDFAVFMILILLIIRGAISEIYLGSVLKISVAKYILQELTVALSFVVSSWFVGGIIGTCIYLALLVALLLWNRVEMLSGIKRLIKK